MSAALLAAGWTPAGAAPPRPLVDPPVPDIPQRYLDQDITWATCGFDAAIKSLVPDAPTTRCAKVAVPMDWNEPDAHPDIEVAIAFSEATGTSRGLMTTNPGGPGAGGRTLSAALAIDKPGLFEDYDLLGFDPRGFGSSTRLRCLTTSEALEALPVIPDYRRRDAQTHATELAEAQLLAEACAATEFGRFVSSQQTVHDMEFLRRLLAQQGKLNFIGYSYGTWLGGWYADTHPANVDRFVLDSNMDWTQTQWENMSLDTWSFQRRRDTQLLPWIARHAAEYQGLGDTPAEVAASYEELRAALDAAAGEGDDLDLAIAGRLYSNGRFPQAGALLEELAAHHGTAGDLRADALADARARAADSPDAVIDLGSIGTTVRCNDTGWTQSAEWYQREADRQTKRHPFSGYFNGVPMCAFWPHPPQDRKVDLAGSPRLLMIQAELDPATAYEGALRTHRLTADATRLVSIDDEGQHGQYVGSASGCAEAVGDAFVFDGVMPAADVLCDTSPLPLDTAVFPVAGPVDGRSVPLRGPKSVGRPGDVNPLLQEVLDRTAALSG